LRELNSLQVRTQKKPGRFRAGPNLWLQVSPASNGDGVVKSWLLRYVIDGRERLMGLGSLRLFSLQEARARAKRHLQLLADGIDPLEARREQRDARRAEANERITFRDATKKFLELHEAGWKNAKHRQQWGNTLEIYAFPTLGSRPVSAVDAAVINEVLAPIWTKTPETARRVKQRIERVTQWVRDGMPLPMQGASKSVTHHAALPYGELPGFMAKLRAKNSISARALELTILTAARTSEVTGARWEEIEGDVWTVPAERMKGACPHRVPLSRRAIDILGALPRDDSGFIFLGPSQGKPISYRAMFDTLKGMHSGATVHGFRSSFSDWARECTSYPRDVIEQALAHTIKDKSEAAYRRMDALPKRTKLMAEWASFCASPAVDGKVLPIGEKRGLQSG
jgi:integrase